MSNTEHNETTFGFDKDFYFVLQNQDEGIFWVIDLYDHPNSFLLSGDYHHVIPRGKDDDPESMVIIQPNNF
ncbi:MAG: hypothetical protein Kow00127_19360 [Bacteroidales bacterium]